MSLRPALPAESGTIYRSVRDFGADGSGTHDDTQAIRNTITAVCSGMPATGGVVFFPAGRYLIRETLVIDKPGVTLMGEGRGGPTTSPAAGTTLLFDSSKTNAAVLIRNSQYSGIKNLVIFRQGAAGVADGRRKEPAIKLDNTYHCFLKEVLLVAAVSGIEILDGISPVLEDIDIKDPVGDFGVWIHGSGGAAPNHRKVDAALFCRLSGRSRVNTKVEWVVIGPNVDGAAVQDARFVEGSRGLVLRGGDPANHDTRPKYIHTYRFGSDHAVNEAVLIEEGNDVFMVNTWIGQNRNASGLVIGPRFTGGAELTNLRIRGSGGHGMHIMGGRNIYIANPMIGACYTNRTLQANSQAGCGILIESGVKHLRVTGGGVGPLSETGRGSKQYYGIRYLGSAEQALTDSVRISGVDTSDNPVGYEPPTLSLDRMQ